MRHVTCLLASALVALAAPQAHAGGDGLAADSGDSAWSHLRGRVAYAASLPTWRDDPARLDRSGLKVHSLSVMGDLYLGDDRAAANRRSRGFRATSGVIIGTPASLWGSSSLAAAQGPMSIDRRIVSTAPAGPGLLTESSSEMATLPYLGIGYSSLASRSGWSFSADLGVVSLAPGRAARFGRVFGGGQNLDDVVRELRLTPVLQLGVSYAF